MSENLADGFTPAQVESFQALNDPVTQGGPPGSEQDFFATAVVPLLSAAAAPDVPTIILTADQWLLTAEVVESGRAAGTLPEFVTVESADALWASQLAAQDVLASKFPGGEHVTETAATHYIHLDNPQLVIDSIRDVVDQVRASTPG